MGLFLASFSLAIIATAAVGVQDQNTYSGWTCQTSDASPSATDLNNMGLALQDAPQATTQYCSGTGTSGCQLAVDYNTAAVNICATTGQVGLFNKFCIYGSDLGKAVQNLAITCRNGNNLSGGYDSVAGSDDTSATVSVYHY